MARIRSSKPEWWKKEKWCRLPRDVRFTFKGLWEVMADDEGRFQADPRHIKAEVWPLDDDITPKKIGQWLTQLTTIMVRREDETKISALQLYEVDGVQYGYVPGFEKHQKISHPTPSKLPPPPEPFWKRSEKTPEDVGTPPEELQPDTDKDVDVDLEKDSDTDGSAIAGVDITLISKLVAVANRGLAEHRDPTHRQAVPRIIATVPKSRAAVEAIVTAGVPIRFAEEQIFAIATTCEPDGPITSMQYFATAVLRAWKQERAKRDAAGVTPIRRARRTPDQYTYTETTEPVTWAK